MPETTRDRCITPSLSPSTYHRRKLMDGKYRKPTSRRLPLTYILWSRGPSIRERGKVFAAVADSAQIRRYRLLPVFHLILNARTLRLPEKICHNGVYAALTAIPVATLLHGWAGVNALSPAHPCNGVRGCLSSINSLKLAKMRRN